MTFELKKIRSVGSYFALLFFFVFFLRPLGEIAILIMSLLLVVLLVALFLKHKLQVNGIAFIIYGLLTIGVVNYILGSSWYDYYFPILVPFFPFLLIHYLVTVPKKNIPFGSALLIMAMGLFVSVIYQTVLHNGFYGYGWLGDYQFSLAFLVFLTIFMLLELGIISLRYVVIALILSVFPEIIYVIVLYFQHGLASKILTERFGNSVEIQANQIASWLDISFPLVLFVAIHEKKIFSKNFFFLPFGCLWGLHAFDRNQRQFFRFNNSPAVFCFHCQIPKGDTPGFIGGSGCNGYFWQGHATADLQP